MLFLLHICWAKAFFLYPIFFSYVVLFTFLVNILTGIIKKCIDIEKLSLTVTIPKKLYSF